MENVPGIRVHPPVLFAGGLAAGWLLERVMPLPLGPTASPSRLAAALAIATIGVAIALWAVLLFRRVRTGIPVHHAVTSLVTGGPYRWSRNPIYLGLVLVYAAAALALNIAWPLILLPAVLLALHALVIRREEALLARLFGDSYRAYARSVRRWF